MSDKILSEEEDDKITKDALDAWDRERRELAQATGSVATWFHLKITRNQLAHLDLLCRFHLSESVNDFAKAETERLRWCLTHWPKPRSTDDAWIAEAARELAMDSAYIPCIAAIIRKHWNQQNDKAGR